MLVGRTAAVVRPVAAGMTRYCASSTAASFENCSESATPHLTDTSLHKALTRDMRATDVEDLPFIHTLQNVRSNCRLLYHENT